MQVIPSSGDWASEMVGRELNLLDPQDNVTAGVAILGRLLATSPSTDTAIANQLGINVRSVRRWISELMDELGVTTRLQLGAALVRARQIHTNRVRA